MSNTARMSAKAPVILGPLPGTGRNMCLVWRDVKAKAVCGRTDGSSLDSRSHQTPKYFIFRGMTLRQHVSSIIPNFRAEFRDPNLNFHERIHNASVRKTGAWLTAIGGFEMVGGLEGVAEHPFTGVEVRAQLIKYLADSLRDLPREGRTFVYLGRVLAGTEWSLWMQHVEPVTQSSGRSAFRFAYKFHPDGEWDAEILRNRLLELWRIWGWNCAIEDQSTVPEYSVAGRSPEGHQLTFRGRHQRRLELRTRLIVVRRTRQRPVGDNAVRGIPIWTTIASDGVGRVPGVDHLVKS